MFYRVTRLMRRFYLAAGELHWSVLLGVVLAHMAISYGLMRIAGEAELQAPAPYIYWYITTALTVGYGDLSPKSDLGRLLASFFVMPGAIACFTAALAKTLDGVASTWRQKRLGRGDFSEMKNAIVLIGYDRDRTPRMIDEIFADTAGAAEIILYSREQFDNMDPRFRYVHATSLTSTADMQRAGIAEAGKIVIFTASDEEALAAALAVTALNDYAHIVAYFNERSNASLLHAHCPRVETVLTPSVELVVKALSDPGSSQLLTELASHTDDGATLYAAAVPSAGKFEEIATRLRKYSAVLVAFERAGVRDVQFDFEGDIAAGDKIFYISCKRLPTVWA